jgi:hypothetical protein
MSEPAALEAVDLSVHFAGRGGRAAYALDGGSLRV